jgi:uncharacterized membrane protein
MRLHIAAAALLGFVLSAPVHGQAAEVVYPPLQFDVVAPNGGEKDGALPELRRSLPRAITYQTIVIATDQLLYWAIISGTVESELEFLAGNAVTGVAYYVAFDELWAATGLDTGTDGNEVNVTKALAYRLFDTARVFGVTMAIGTPLAGSLEVAAAIAATRTAIYVLHDYAWWWATGSGGTAQP